MRAHRMTIVTVALAGLVATGCSSSSDSDSTGATADPAVTPAPADGTAAASAGVGSVSIVDFAFAPADLTVAVGTAITWTNNDGAPHRIESDDGSFDSDDLSGGDTFEHTFDSAGSFPYLCGIHASMSGTITVTG